MPHPSCKATRIDPARGRPLPVPHLETTALLAAGGVSSIVAAVWLLGSALWISASLVAILRQMAVVGR